MIGQGRFSSDLLAAITASPTQPQAPVRNNFLSTKTSIAFSWQPVADGPGLSGAEITGYRIYMTREIGGTYTLLFDGSDFRTITSFIVDDL